MSFYSPAFAVFIAALISAVLLARGDRARQLLLLAGGVIFYGWWNWRCLALLAFTSVFDFYLGQRIAAAEGARRKRLLLLDVLVNLAILVTFKYFGFFVENINAALAPFGARLPLPHIILPVGISFFVFEAMSYCIDIYRGKLAPYTNWLHFALFIFFFPRMIAGPIIRAADFLPQLRDRRLDITWASVNRGACIFILGLIKKVLVADRLAMLVDPVFAHPAAFDSPTVWAAVVGYAIQIFCDFSGYTDMAIGLAKIFGLDLPLNFNLPYLSTTIGEFWRRWHISLSSWLRDYLYISLGGNRGGELRTYLNLFITMLLGGLWHGASWNFVVWGGLHGGALAVERMILRGRPLQSPAARAAGGALTFLFVCVCWVFFRARDFSVAATVLSRMFVPAAGVRWIYQPFWPLVTATVVWHVLRRRTNEHFTLALGSFAGWLLLWSTLYLLFFAAPSESHPFIYFQF